MSSFTTGKHSEQLLSCFTAPHSDCGTRKSPNPTNSPTGREFRLFRAQKPLAPSTYSMSGAKTGSLGNRLAPAC